MNDIPRKERERELHNQRLGASTTFASHFLIGTLLLNGTLHLPMVVAPRMKWCGILVSGQGFGVRLLGRSDLRCL